MSLLYIDICEICLLNLIQSEERSRRLGVQVGRALRLGLKLRSEAIEPARVLAERWIHFDFHVRTIGGEESFLGQIIGGQAGRLSWNWKTRFAQSCNNSEDIFRFNRYLVPVPSSFRGCTFARGRESARAGSFVSCSSTRTSQVCFRCCPSRCCPGSFGQPDRETEALRQMELNLRYTCVYLKKN